MQNPNVTNLVEAKRILRYLAGTRKLGLKYNKNSKSIAGFADASYGEQEDRKSTTGYVFLQNGAAITWSSKKQPIVALSTMEAELIALTSATKESCWLTKLQEDLKEKKEAMTIHQDNQGTIQFIYDGNHSEKSKHIAIRFFFAREKLEDGEIKLQYTPSNQMVADILTKAIGANRFKEMREALGLKEIH
jgi:hypothetical protein